MVSNNNKKSTLLARIVCTPFIMFIAIMYKHMYITSYDV